MASTASSIVGFEIQGDGENPSTWGTKADGAKQRIEEAFGAVNFVTIADSVPTTTLTQGDYTTQGQARAAVIVFTGTLTATRSVILPNKQKTFYLVNGATQSLSFTSGSSSALVIPSGSSAPVYTTGNNQVRIAMNWLPDFGVGENLILLDDGTDAALNAKGNIVMQEGGTEFLSFERGTNISNIKFGDTRIGLQNDNILFTRGDTHTGINLQTLMGFADRINTLEQKVRDLGG